MNQAIGEEAQGGGADLRIAIVEAMEHVLLKLENESPAEAAVALRRMISGLRGRPVDVVLQ